MDKPAILGGPVAFAALLPVARPTLPELATMSGALDASLRSGMITNGRHVRAFEEEAAAYLGVAHTVAMSSCTSGLMLVLRCTGVTGPVVVPSFTFMAGGHAVRWAGAAVRFADSDPRRYTVDVRSAAAALAGDASGGAILATHTFGVPCDAAGLGAVAEERGVPLLFDAAHAFGSRYPDGTMVGGAGLAEVFSLSPTKPLSTGEGGLVATNDAALAAELRVAREYGNPGDYDSRYAGLNARMAEAAAVLGRTGLADFPEWLDRRRALAARYRANLADVPGLAFQQVPPGALSTYKDLTVRVGPELGLTRAQLAGCLRAENVDTRAYFDPPLHRQTAYRDVAPVVPLDHTDRLSAAVLTLPLHSHMRPDVIDRVCAAIRTIAASAGDLAVHFGQEAA